MVIKKIFFAKYLKLHIAFYNDLFEERTNELTEVLTKEAKRREDWISLSDEEKLSSPDTGEIRQAVVGEQGIRTLKKIKK